MNLNDTFAAVQAAGRHLALLPDDRINQILNAVAEAALEQTSYILPRGEGRVATLRISEAIPRSRSSVNLSRSYFGLSGDIRSRSFRFSERM